jgi:hypothetical protein
MRIVCCKCGRILRVAQHGVWALELACKGGRPYRLLNFDRYTCPRCGVEVLAGHGEPVYADPGSEEYERYLKEVEVQFW